VNKSIVHLFHIGYSIETMELLQPGFTFLDNLANERPDWFESWPIRNYLKNNKLDDNDYYGFFSPRFLLKTGRSSSELRHFISTDNEDTEAYFICPQAEVGAFFLNPVYGMDFSDPGTLDTTQKLIDKVGLDLNINLQLIDSSQLAYSNYVIGKASYWKKWLEIVDIVYHYAETGSDISLKKALNYPTQYNNGVQRKVFLIECIPSILFNHLNLKVKSIPINHDKAGRGVMYKYLDQANKCDELKKMFKKTNDFSHVLEFQKISEGVLSNFKKVVY